MIFIITGIEEGQYGGSNTPLTQSNLLRIDKFIDESIGKNVTGTEIDLSNLVGNNYNYSNPSSSETYTFVNPTINGFARCFINTESEPVVEGATKVSGDDFIEDETMEMVVESPDGENAEYYFLKR